MLKDYPIFFNATELPTPKKWDETFSTVETVNVTEAGTDQVLVARYGKLSVAAQFDCSSRWAHTFSQFRDAGPLSVSSYDLKTEDYKTRRMRMRDFKSSPVEGSEKVPGTTGLYSITFSLEEY